MPLNRRVPTVESGDGSQAVIGFTEAELGLVLAVVFLVLWIIARSNTPTAQPGVSADSVRALNDSIASMRADRAALKPKTSRKTPSCVETKIATGPIASIEVTGRDSFVMSGRAYSWRSLAAKLEPELRRAATPPRCRQQVRMSFDPRISSTALDAAYRRLASEFDVLRLGAFRGRILDPPPVRP